MSWNSFLNPQISAQRQRSWNSGPLRPHQVSPGYLVRLYHVYDTYPDHRSSQTPFEPGVGICCGDYRTNTTHVISPLAVRQHLNWSNRNPTQFISFYDDLDKAHDERNRRAGSRPPDTVHIVVVDLKNGQDLWANNKQEIMEMMQAFGDTAFDINATMGRNEWLVWGCVLPQYVAGHVIDSMWDSSDDEYTKELAMQ